MEIDNLVEIADRLERAESLIHDETANHGLAALEESVQRAEAAWSGSWLGYHSRVYYKGLNPPPQDATFSDEWGLQEGKGGQGRISTGEWRKCRSEDVIAAIWRIAGNPNLNAIRQEAAVAAQIFEAAKHEVWSALKNIPAERANDESIVRGVEKIEQASIRSSQDFIEKWMPLELPISMDGFAVGEGMQVPPHILVKADVRAIRYPFTACGQLAKLVRSMVSLLSHSGGATKLRLPPGLPQVVTVQPMPPGQRRQVGKDGQDIIPVLLPAPPPPATRPNLLRESPHPPVENPVLPPSPAAGEEIPKPTGMTNTTPVLPVARPLGMRAPASLAKDLPDGHDSSAPKAVSPMFVARAIGLKPPNSGEPNTGDDAGTAGICLGHGHSSQWKDLRESLSSELQRDCHEFNCVPMAGVSNLGKVDELCRKCSLAVFILTEEDIRLQGDRHAETNVIHTAGLFQGRLGYGRVVLLMEEGCEGLSHLQDLPQITYPPGGIAGVVGELKSILAREKVTA